MVEEIETAENPTAEESVPLPAPGRWLLDLYFAPTTFFRHYVVIPAPGMVLLASYLVGLASATDSLSGRIERGRFESAGGSWSSFWLFSAIAGVVCGAVVFSLGSWWYRKRLNFCGCRTTDRALARRVYLFASLVWAVPWLLELLSETARYDTPLAAMQGDGLMMIAPIVMGAFLFWSVVTSYRGATVAFALQRGRARWWFLILPVAGYGMIILTALVAVLYLGIAEQPEVTRYKVVDQPGFQLHYPGNWFIDESDPDFNLDHWFVIGPALADCSITVDMDGSFVEPEEGLSAYRQALEQSFAVDGWAEPRKFGSHDAVALTAVAEHSGGGRYVISIYALAHDGRVAVIVEMCAEDIAAKMAPGFELVRRTFRWW